MLKSFGANLSFESEAGEWYCRTEDLEIGGDLAYVERVLDREEKMKRGVYRAEEDDVGDSCCIMTRDVESDCIWRIHGGV